MKKPISKFNGEQFAKQLEENDKDELIQNFIEQLNILMAEYYRKILGQKSKERVTKVNSRKQEVK